MERPPLGQVQDLATLAKLDETVLLDEIKERYRNDQIYTYVGDILIAVNPFKDLGIYSEKYSARYRNIKQSLHPPHIFAVSDAAYQALLGHRGRPPGNQCILISGESGAGKTESTKLIIKQIVDLCRGNTQLEQQILQVNPLLEAFGNAQTNLNNNSSRFGKYIQLKFQGGRLAGAKISEYLLEKSRVVRQNAGEENFHIFYYLFASDLSKIFGLKDPSQYRYITHLGKHVSKNQQFLLSRYEELVNAMDLVGFTDKEQQDLFVIIAGVLQLGNISFDENSSDAVSISGGIQSVQNAAKLLGIESSEVEACLTHMVTVIKGQHIQKDYKMEQAEDARDAMAKTIYGRLFGWIVNKINHLLAHDITDQNIHYSEIGILDIFGFEDFARDGGKNSFEQACINLANEQLQSFFNQHILHMEQEEYQREGLDWKVIKFVDNKPLLDLFLATPIGILSLLDEESLFPKGTDQSFVDKLSRQLTSNEYFTKSQKTNHPVFSIQHYAGKVTYSADKWLEKNRDTLPPGISEMMQSSSNDLMKIIFKATINRTGSLVLPNKSISSKKNNKHKMVAMNSPAQKGSDTRKLTVGAQFKNSLKVLMDRMTSSTPIFVRCLKPNHLKQSGHLDEQYVRAQLLYTGMLETVEIRRKGFAVRPTFEHFVEKYKILVNLKLPHSVESCKKILQYVNLHDWCIGKTKVFLKHKHIEDLTELLDKLGLSAICIQRVTRGFLARKKYKRLQEQARLEKERREAEARLAQTSLLQRAEITNTTSQTPSKVSKGTDANCATDELDQEAAKHRKSKMDAVSWFKQTQTENVRVPNQDKFAEWFHGIISRKESERLLQNKFIGCYLIRVSESRFGYTLSFKAESRCRHYMIDQLKNDKFIVIGEPKVHRTLQALVDHHKKTKISNWNHLLTAPCGQEHGECDYAELVSELVHRNPEPMRNGKKPELLAAGSTLDPYCLATQTTGKRPLPKLPEESDHKLMNEQDLNQNASSLRVADRDKRVSPRSSPRVSPSRQRP